MPEQLKNPFAFSRNNIISNLVCIAFFSLIALSCSAQPLNQKKGFTRQDSLRGTITPERAWWDLLHYRVSVTPDYVTKSIEGSNVIDFKVLKQAKRMQLDLQAPMIIDSIALITYQAPKDNIQLNVLTNKSLSFKREGNVYWVEVPELPVNSTQSILVKFHGTPREAIRPPWDGGWIWAKDAKGRPWMSVACQGLGASVWYPCKDHQSDEPDNGAALNITVPDSLAAVGNGRLYNQWHDDQHKTTTYGWRVTDPINNYNIIPYIGKYISWIEVYPGEKGNLDCSYYVLDYEEEKAKEQFKQVPVMLKSFEYWFGPYPFYEDGYKLVQAPHLGMEHQSAVAYGNRFMNGYLGRDLSGSGWGKKWDFIIVHESGHEWFANNITSRDIADMWLHEGFTNYSETLFTSYNYGVEAGNEYCIGSRRNIQNDIPVIGHYGVNQEGSGDMYSKGGSLLHNIRQIIRDDEKFRQILRGLNKEFYHKTTTTEAVEAYISKHAGKDFSKVFDQYLRTTNIPVLEYKVDGHKLQYRWQNVVKGFAMPVKVTFKNERWITPTEKWQTLDLYPEGDNSFKADPNFYVTVKKVN